MQETHFKIKVLPHNLKKRSHGPRVNREKLNSSLIASVEFLIFVYISLL